MIGEDVRLEDLCDRVGPRRARFVGHSLDGNVDETGHLQVAAVSHVQMVKGKKNQQASSEGPTPCPQKELFHRVNYTYQASVYLQSLGLGSSRRSTPTSHVMSADNHLDKVEDGEEPDWNALARQNMKSTKKMVVHTLLKLSELPTLADSAADKLQRSQHEARCLPRLLKHPCARLEQPSSPPRCAHPHMGHHGQS